MLMAVHICLLKMCQSLSHVCATSQTKQAFRLLCPQNSPGKNTGVGCHSLLQGIFWTQGSNLSLLDCMQILYRLSHQESPLFPQMSSNIYFFYHIYPFRHFLPLMPNIFLPDIKVGMQKLRPYHIKSIFRNHLYVHLASKSETSQVQQERPVVQGKTLLLGLYSCWKSKTFL